MSEEGIARFRHIAVEGPIGAGKTTLAQLLAKRNAFTTPWGVSRRLLTGPFESEKVAQDFVNQLKAAGLDAFAFTSEEGQEIAPLK